MEDLGDAHVKLFRAIAAKARATLAAQLRSKLRELKDSRKRRYAPSLLWPDQATATAATLAAEARANLEADLETVLGSLGAPVTARTLAAEVRANLEADLETVLRNVGVPVTVRTLAAEARANLEADLETVLRNMEVPVTARMLAADARAKIAAALMEIGVDGGSCDHPAFFVELNAVVMARAGDQVRRRDANAWLHAYGVYIASFGDLTERNNAGELVFSDIGLWVGTLGEDPRPYENAELVKFGYTGSSFIERIAAYLTVLKAAGIPQAKMRVVVKGVFLGLPSDTGKLRFAEATVKNTFARRGLRVYHRVDPNLKAVPAGYRSNVAEFIELACWTDKESWKACIEAENRINTTNGLQKLTTAGRLKYIKHMQGITAKASSVASEPPKRCRIGACPNPCFSSRVLYTMKGGQLNVLPR
ncbi:hypothetical protein PR003_g4680 [Phytophthora rubi]|uniref:Uncharacterized protein n=1 Tax=Phytophthora rubi TaxID=129364 RepID=A0A6A3MQA6_9STRA|nr:hypothetical protein PR001_g11014 [Phytophthora rubi]KAE9351881.1 hypothetical protein PR003_g4680 [Phytophthora rubi]